MSSWIGKYTLVSSDKFDEYMAAVGVGWTTRKLASAATPTTYITQDNDNWNIKTETTFKTTEIKFKIGEEFDEVTGDGRKCKSKILKESDNKMVHLQNCNGLELKSSREFAPDGQMTMILEAPGGVVCTRVYKKV